MVTRFPARAAVLDAEGNPLQLSAPAYELGVWPDRLASQAATARAFAAVTELQAGQILGQIAAAPPNQFVRLATLDPGTYGRLRSSLRSVPGLVVRQVSERLFQARATGLVGGVGSEVNPQLRADGAFYVPGTTVGLSGLEAAYQRQLLGTPTDRGGHGELGRDADRCPRALAGRGGHARSDHDQPVGAERGPERAGRRGSTRARSSRSRLRPARSWPWRSGRAPARCPRTAR